MDEPDIDRLLRRRLNLQRYVTSLVSRSIKQHAAGDRAILNAIEQFIDGADERTLTAFTRLRTSNASARELLTVIRETISAQRDATLASVLRELPDLIDKEARVVAGALGNDGADPVALLGVASQPTGSGKPRQMIRTAYQRYSERLLTETREQIRVNPRNVRLAIRGTRGEQYRDGVFHWRNERLLRPNIDEIVNGASSNAAERVYEAYRVEQVTHLATLDYRTCPRCVAAEANGPYDIGRAPSLPVHPRCRCVNVPYVEGMRNERGYFRDTRSLKDVPVEERVGGTTRMPIEQFFNRMSKADRVAYMGPSRAALWEAGKITDIRDLVEKSTLRELTLDELPDLPRRRT